MANRICLLCKESFPIVDMQKLGKSGFVCRDHRACMLRKLALIRAESSEDA